MNILPEFMDEEDEEQQAFVQIITLTINGTRYGLVGPVVHVPGITRGRIDIDVTEIEFGEIMSVGTAARMLEGDFKKVMGAGVQ